MKEYSDNRELYEKAIQEYQTLHASLADYKAKCDQQQKAYKELQDKYNELYELSHETEKVVQRRVAAVDRARHMKEEEVARLKQILYGKEDVIRKISIAYEQSK